MVYELLPFNDTNEADINVIVRRAKYYKIISATIVLVQ